MRWDPRCSPIEIYFSDFRAEYHSRMPPTETPVQHSSECCVEAMHTTSVRIAMLGIVSRGECVSHRRRKDCYGMIAMNSSRG